MTGYFTHVDEHTGFSAEKPAKADLFRGEHLFVGLNCYEPGQFQALHSHAGADKFYLVISGKARLRVGDEAHEAGPGSVVWAPAGIPHGVEEALMRTVMLVGMTVGHGVSGPGRP
ncbi:MAG TPA: cupin domain-containing protein [Gemmatimonadales bacterium]|nr:cupin domain-containing protein [Gemmatimonadales bacterium]